MSEYQLKIDFVPDSGSPSRVFHSMAGLIDSFSRFDRDLVDCIDLPIASQLLLHDIERGSLKAILRWILQTPDREALREGDWKKVLGRVIDDGRTYLLKRLDDQPRIVDKEQLTDIQAGLTEIVSAVPAGLIHVPRPIPLPRLLTAIQSVESSTRILIEGDSASYRSEYSERRISTRIEIGPSLEDELLETIPIQRPTRIQLPVKKPDLISDSQWDLYMGSHVIRAKILDVEWLTKFHKRVIELKPGDALDALLEITLLQSHDGEIVNYKYQVLQVFGVMPHRPSTQLQLPDSGS